MVGYNGYVIMANNGLRRFLPLGGQGCVVGLCARRGVSSVGAIDTVVCGHHGWMDDREASLHYHDGGGCFFL